MPINFDKINSIPMGKSITTGEKNSINLALNLAGDATQDGEEAQEESDNILSIGALQRKSEQNMRERELAREAYREYQKNTIKSEALQEEILQGVQEGEEPYTLFLKAVEAIGIMTNNQAYYLEIRKRIIAIYGYGMLEKAPLMIGINDTKKRLEKLYKVFDMALIESDRERIWKGIEAHKRLIAEMEDLTERG